jgi:hypothetical protein
LGRNLQKKARPKALRQYSQETTREVETFCPVAQIHGFFERVASDMHAGDWIQAALLLVGILALCWTALTLREQTRTRDFENYLSLMERFTAAWRRFADAEVEEKKQFEFIELINLFEATCHLYNKKIVRGATRDMVRDYLKEIIFGIFANADAKMRIDESFSSPDTYCEIRRFARTEKIANVPQKG